MGSICLLVAHEHRSSRDVLTAAIKMLRPAIEVINLEPELLDEALLRWRPKLVICSRLTQGVEASQSDWIVLYPEGERRVEQRIAGHRATAEDLDFGVLLAYLDRLVGLARYGRGEQSRGRQRSSETAGCLR